MTAGDWLVGIGTLALAGATVWLAKRTSDLAHDTNAAVAAANKTAESAEAQASAAHTQAIASQEQAAVAAEALEGSVRPILADVPPGLHMNPERPATVHFDSGQSVDLQDWGATIAPTETESHASCTVALRNIGAGVAIIRGFGLRFPGHVGWSGSSSRSVVPPGEMTRLTFSIPTDRTELAEGIQQLRAGNFTVEVLYTDILGRIRLITRADCYRTSGVDFRVRQILLSKEGEEPFAASGPADG